MTVLYENYNISENIIKEIKTVNYNLTCKLGKLEEPFEGYENALKISFYGGNKCLWDLDLVFDRYNKFFNDLINMINEEEGFIVKIYQSEWYDVGGDPGSFNF